MGTDDNVVVVGVEVVMPDHIGVAATQSSTRSLLFSLAVDRSV